jgi:hypothetical protein
MRRRFRRQPARLAIGVAALGAVAAALLLVPGAGGVPGDPTPPEITPVTFGTLGTNGWYASTVTVGWVVTDTQSIILETRGCEPKTFTADTAGQSLTCYARSDGGETSKSRTIKVDVTPPAVTSAAARAPDANGWYNRAVGIGFSGTDATSGVTSCSSIGYGGPDSPGAVLTGTCRDNAGNVGSGAFALKYDATPPTVSALQTRPQSRAADVSWRASPDAKLVEVTRAPGVNGAPFSVVYRGTGASFRDKGLLAGLKYTYMVAVTDEAGNSTGAQVKHVGTGALLRPAPAERVTAPPLLTWTRVKGATYYHVQVLRGTRVLAAWPTTTTLQLKRTWVMNGRRFRLRPGTYRWYVWPGYGRVSAVRYGGRLGGSTFVVSG